MPSAPAPVRLVRDSPTLFYWETDCPNCGALVFEYVTHAEADCEACGARVRVDLLRMRATPSASSVG